MQPFVWKLLQGEADTGNQNKHLTAAPNFAFLNLFTHTYLEKIAGS